MIKSLIRLEAAGHPRLMLALAAAAAAVLTDTRGFTLYSFAPDTSASRSATAHARRTGRRSSR